MPVPVPLLTQIAQTNRQSAHRLNMSVKTYSLLKIMVRLLAIAAGIYAMSLDADPTWIFTIIGLIVIGPDLLETAVAEDGVTISIDDGNEGG